MITYRKDYCIANGCVWKDQNGLCSRLSCKNRIVRVETIREHIIFDAANGVKKLKKVLDAKRDHSRVPNPNKINHATFPKKPVIGIDKKGKRQRYESINDAARAVGANHENIIQAINRNGYSHDIKWMYADKPVHSS